MAEANVHDGMVNYNHFMPIAAKTIEIMCEPKALRQRAELIEKTDLSAEALLKGMSTEEFEQKLTTLFRSYDVDRSGLLDKDEFRACLESLDFHIPEATLNSMLIAASLSKGTELTFDDFMKFFRDNLLELEREKHIQMLQQSVHAAPKSKMESFDGSVLAQGGHASAAAVATAIASADTKAEKIEDFHGLLMKIFKLADPQNKGYLAHKDFEKLLESLQLDISKFQLECLLSELPHHEELIKYEEFIPICAELLTVRLINSDYGSKRLDLVYLLHHYLFVCLLVILIVVCLLVFRRTRHDNMQRSSGRERSSGLREKRTKS